jgi:SAM-dependent methyltransferase
VLADEQYRRDQLTDQGLRRFFDSGERHVDQLLRTIRDRLDPRFVPSSVLDYGCGVGRTLVPFAQRVARVVGLDVSDAMLAEARRNCDERSLGNVTLARADDSLSSLSGVFDLVHSLLVFQHVEVTRGERVLAALVERLTPGGIGALHFLVASDRGWLRRALSQARGRVPGLHGLVNVLRGKQIDEPLAQMNVYDLPRVLRQLRRQGIEWVVCESDEQDGNVAVMLYFQKPPLAPAEAPSPGGAARPSTAEANGRGPG